MGTRVFGYHGRHREYFAGTVIGYEIGHPYPYSVTEDVGGNLLRLLEREVESDLPEVDTMEAFLDWLGQPPL